MMRSLSQFRLFLLVFVSAVLLLVGQIRAQSVDVTAQIELKHPGKQHAAAQSQSSGVVLWLDPIADTPAKITPGHFRLVQKDKKFNPHLLIVPVGSAVDFPNMDTFFHNVFSQFNGKRFDLGLYEAGSTRTVHFNREGISYIFCNIHPEMSAVVIALTTPYVGVSSDNGSIMLHNIPAGTYRVHIWGEGVDTQQLDRLSHNVQIDSSESSLGVFALTKADTIAPHKNKFGEDYKPEASPVYGPSMP